MKYTSEDLAMKMFEEDLSGDLLTAIMNNDSYKVLPVRGKVEKNQDIYEFVFDDIGLELEPYALTDISNEDCEKMIANKENVNAILLLYNQEIKVLIDYYDGSNEERNVSIWSKVFADLFTSLEIDTLGKAKKFIQTGIEKQLKYNEIDAKLSQLFDQGKPKA